MADPTNENSTTPATPATDAQTTSTDATPATDGQGSSNNTAGESGDTNNDTGSSLLTASKESERDNSVTDDNTSGDSGDSDSADGKGFEDFNIPDGFEMDKNLLDSATKMFADSGLSQEQAQKFIDLYTDSVKGALTAHVDSGNQAFLSLLSCHKGLGSTLRDNFPRII